MTNGTVLLTGANGYIAVHIITVLLERNYTVVGTVRSKSKIPYLEQKFKANPNLKFAIVEDIAQPDAFGPVLKEYKFDYVLHTSSPFTLKAEDVEKDLYEPAINGTVGILKSVKAYAPTVKRVIIVSSFASIVTLAKGAWPGHHYTADEWNPLTYQEGLANGGIGYYASKKLAEQAAWDFVKNENPTYSLTTLCPPMVYGPPEQEIKSLDGLNTSVAEIYGIFKGKGEAHNSVWFCVDVRDIALAHVLAIVPYRHPRTTHSIADWSPADFQESPAAPGQRYLITLGNYSAQQFLDYIWEHYPDRAKEKGIPKGTPGKLWPEGGVYTGDVAKSEKDLGFKYRSFDTMIKDTLERLLQLEKELQ